MANALPGSVRGDLLAKVEADQGTAGREVRPASTPAPTQTTTLLLTEDVGNLRTRVQALHQDVADTHQQTHSLEWRERTSRRVRETPRELLADLGDLGFGWRDIARLLGVSVAAVQKWRRGESMSGDNRQRVAALCAGCDLLAAHFYVEEIASWFETPLVAGSGITPIDLWSADRQDLVFEYASSPQADPELILSDLDPDWRDALSNDFEVVRGEDGNLSIRPKA